MFRACRTLAAAAGLSLTASGCFYYPRTVEYYDADCEIRARQMVLRSEAMQVSCSGYSTQSQATGCLALILGVSAGSAIVSGSIVVAGNTVYWLEKRGRCIAKSQAS